MILAVALPNAAGAQAVTDEPVADSVAHPIVTACGVRLDPAAYLGSALEGDAVTAEEDIILDRLESELRQANTPLGTRWLEGNLDQEERRVVLTDLRANYRAWWQEVEDLLGADRASALVDPPAAKPDRETGAVRCLKHSVLAILGVG